MGTALRKAQARAKKLDALNAAPDKGAARKEKLRMASVWMNRGASPGDYHKPENVGGRPLPSGRNRSHLVTSL